MAMIFSTPDIEKKIQMLQITGSSQTIFKLDGVGAKQRQKLR